MSKFKIVKKRVNSTDALVGATSIASIIANVADMAQCIPARAAASVVLVILKTVQEIDNNKITCYKLARRSAKILVDLNTHMAGRWDTAPKALVNNIHDFERVLVCIRDFMQGLKAVNWMNRFLHKGSIEASLSDFHALLDEAEKSFQIASLLEIHYSVGILQERSAGRAITYVESPTGEIRDESILADTLAKTLAIDNVCRNDCNVKPSASIDRKHSTELIFPINSTAVTEDIPDGESDGDAEEIQLQQELNELERLGLTQYHQKDLLPLSELKSDESYSFWGQSMIASAGDKRVMIKRYNNEVEGKKTNLKRWLHDIKTLRNLYHPNLPQLTGYSNEKSPIPFIVLSQTKLRDPSAYFLRSLQRMSIAEGAVAAVKIYRDISSAALYIQKQLSLDDRETQQFIAEASYKADTQCGKIIVGIPPPTNSTWGFGYPLTESLLSTTMQILPSSKTLTDDHLSHRSDIVDLQDKLTHIRMLARALLPRSDQEPKLGNHSEALLEDIEFEKELDSISLRSVRSRSIRAGTHDFAWGTNVHSSPVTFTVGDFGYIPHDHGRICLTDKARFDHFVKVGNVFDDLTDGTPETDGSLLLSIVREVTGSHGQWINGFHKTNEIWPFALPGDVEGWPVALNPGTEMEVHVRHSARIASASEAWRYLQQRAENHVAKLDIRPHELILITKAVSGQIYKVHDWSVTAPPVFNRPPRIAPVVPPHSHAFGHRQMQLPRVLYLFTCYKLDFEPFLADNPTVSTLPRQRDLPRNISLGTAWHRPEAFIEYIQLSQEDFAS
ncbi:uncharacterized protein FOMMEDRAFT_153767 [Fomitiporia mediterranea MF3/22]|uniref:uncharacterized protein n=1 Tax=Fomitiporia mediterranea (strain MF3/22) TaxID=694068 RepID=UPI00044090D8|nr:uncharacterized protein FOMMEDRAFT_153767 [Fomitiporia mediterranea MF3/22]EJD04698.1 hypothetical protein FOMMEDRAFT_153767 [Fomitiporia mediterranea MF3/22]